MHITAVGICLACVTIRTRAIATLPDPIVVFASGISHGHDGPWSTFALEVGTPGQYLEFLPGTSSTQTIVELPETCQSWKSSDCWGDRGGNFNASASTTWRDIGTYGLGLEDRLGYTDYGTYGFDTVALGSGRDVVASVKHIVVAGVTGTEFFRGVFGINPRSTNITDFYPQTSYMSLLKEQGYIPSLSYGYTAGALYRPKSVWGSLVLGGYDQSRSSRSSFISLPFFSDQSRDLTVGLQSISTNATGSQTILLASGIYIFIDSSVTELWLPLSVCQAFESAFGLTYNTTSNLYLVNDTLHNKLLSSNPSVTLTLGGSKSGGSTIKVTLPYASFNLQARYPVVSNDTNWYFPLQRAVNETQYTLGRVFLQEAHLIVDYERGNFTVRPCVWTSDLEYIIAIQPTNTTNSTSGNSSTLTTGGGDSSQTTATATATATATVIAPAAPPSLSSGALAGIAIGAVAMTAVVLGGAYHYVNKSRRMQRKATEPTGTGIGPSSRGRADDPKWWLPRLLRKLLKGSSPAPGRAELQDLKSPAAVEADGPQIFEMPNSEMPSFAVPVMGDHRDDKTKFSFEKREVGTS